MKSPEVTENHIANLVKVFYERGRAHASLGPLFNSVIYDWEPHLGVVQDFWSHVLLRTERYKRHAFPAHVGLPIEREHFDHWLTVFRQAAFETLPEDSARNAIARAEHMSESFRAGLFPLDPIRRP
jgi:hemoglobin